MRVCFPKVSRNSLLLVLVGVLAVVSSPVYAQITPTPTLDGECEPIEPEAWVPLGEESYIEFTFDPSYARIRIAVPESTVGSFDVWEAGGEPEAPYFNISGGDVMTWNAGDPEFYLMAATPEFFFFCHELAPTPTPEVTVTPTSTMVPTPAPLLQCTRLVNWEDNGDGRWYAVQNVIPPDVKLFYRAGPSVVTVYHGFEIASVAAFSPGDAGFVWEFASAEEQADGLTLWVDSVSFPSAVRFEKCVPVPLDVVVAQQTQVTELSLYLSIFFGMVFTGLLTLMLFRVRR